MWPTHPILFTCESGLWKFGIKQVSILTNLAVFQIKQNLFLSKIQLILIKQPTVTSSPVARAACS